MYFDSKQAGCFRFGLPHKIARQHDKAIGRDTSEHEQEPVNKIGKRSGSSGCSQTAVTDPVHEYDHHHGNNPQQFKACMAGGMI